MQKKDDSDSDSEQDSFRSSRDALRKSVSSPELRRSGQALWGKDYLNFEKIGVDKKLQQILKENKRRRAPREEFIGLVGNEWRVEGFSNGANIYHDRGKMSEGVTIRRCTKAVVSLINKSSHVMVESCTDCKIRVKGVVSTVELVHCERVQLILHSSVPVVQIDLCRGIQMVLADPITRPKIVSASNSEISCTDSLGRLEVLPQSMFGEQTVFYLNRTTGKWESVASDQLKSEDGYVELAGVSGSNTDLLGLEAQSQNRGQQQQQQPPPPSKK